MEVIKKTVYKTSDGRVFLDINKANSHEETIKLMKRDAKVKDLEKKVKDLFPISKKVNCEQDKELMELTKKIPSYLEYRIDLYCEFTGIPLRVYSTKFHDSGHQYEKSYSEDIDRILDRPHTILRLGNVVRTYSKESYKKDIVPILEKNHLVIKKYLFEFYTGVLK